MSFAAIYQNNKEQYRISNRTSGADCTVQPQCSGSKCSLSELLLFPLSAGVISCQHWGGGERESAGKILIDHLAMWGVDWEWLSFWRQPTLKTSYKKAPTDTTNACVFVSLWCKRTCPLSHKCHVRIVLPQGVSSFKAASAFLHIDPKSSSAVFPSTPF